MSSHKLTIWLGEGEGGGSETETPVVANKPWNFDKVDCRTILGANETRRPQILP